MGQTNAKEPAPVRPTCNHETEPIHGFAAATCNESNPGPVPGNQVQTGTVEEEEEPQVVLHVV